MGAVKEASYCENCGNFDQDKLCGRPCGHCADLNFAYGNAEGTYTEDPVVDRVINSFVKRSAEGMLKYGLTMSANPLKFMDWVQHAQEEAMDFILYLERLKEEHIKEVADGFKQGQDTGRDATFDRSERPGDYL